MEDSGETPEKKLCLPLDGASTSDYSIGDQIDVDLDETPFTTVTYRKKRSKGIPIVFKSTKAQSFWKVNPNRIANEIVTTAQEKVSSHKITKDGSLVVSVASLSSANKLLALKTVAGIDVAANVPQSYSRNLGKIKNVPNEYTEEQLLEYLTDKGVMSVKRQIAYVPQGDGSVVKQPRDRVILQFREDCPMPTRVFLGFTSHPVEEYFGQAVRCFRCQRHGHVANTCRGPQRCKVCAGPHNYKECSSRNHPKCANCGGPHAASFAGCVRNKEIGALRKHELIHGKTTKRHSPPPNPEAVRSVSPAPPNPIQKRSRYTYAEAIGAAGPRAPPPEAPPAPPPPPIPPRLPPRVPPRKPAIRDSTQTPTPLTARTVEAQTADTNPYSTSLRQNTTARSEKLEKLLLPILFAALKAIVTTLPEA
ncbi:uncharacterized protein ISCGN_012515 [Ixodes scapularis]